MAAKDTRRDYFLLLHDLNGIKTITNAHFYQQPSKSETKELKGGIYYLTSQSNKVSANKTNEKLKFISNEDKNSWVETSEQNFKKLDYRDYELLIAVPSRIGRLKIIESDLYKNIKNVEVNDSVSIELDEHKQNKVVLAKVRYIGTVGNLEGCFFGVEYEKPIGDSDGSKGGHTYFMCQNNYGGFIAIHTIKSVYKRGDFTDMDASQLKHDIQQHGRSKASQALPSQSIAQKINVDDSQKGIANRTRSRSKNCLLNEEDGYLKVGMRVVYFHDQHKKFVSNFKRLHGRLKYIGFLEQFNGVTYAVVETDDKLEVGLRSPNCSNVCRKLKIKKDHCLVVRPLELMSEHSFKEETRKKRNEVENGRDSPTYEMLSNPSSMNSGVQQPSESFADKKKPSLAKHCEDQTEKEPLKNPKNEVKQEDPAKNRKSPNDQTAQLKAAGYSVKDLSNAQPLSQVLGASSDLHHNAQQAQPPNLIDEFKQQSLDSNPGIYESIDSIKNYDSTDQPLPSYRESEFLSNKQNRELKKRQSPHLHQTPAASYNNDRPLGYSASHLPNEKQPRMEVANNFSTTIRNQFSNEQWSSHDPKSFEKDVKIKDGDDTKTPQLTVGMMVEVTVKGETNYGVIKFLGDLFMNNSTLYVAGLELEDYSKFATSDGEFNGQRYFTCPLGKGLFIRAKKCKPDRRFSDHAALEPEKKMVQVAYNQQIEDLEPIPEYIPPPSRIDFECIGMNRGIQGHHNSCYMDSTLFAMFAYCDVFDVALHRKPRKNALKDYQEVQRLLKENIVNPLRKNGYVSQRSVMRLRKILEKHATMGGFMTEEKDPEELVVLLFEKVLNLEPFVKLRTLNGDVNNSLLYQIFPPEIDRTHGPPSLQTLLELSLLESGLFLDEIPSVLALQMPRFGQQKMFERIFINPQLDLTDLIKRMRFCGICEKAAVYLCKDCHKNERLRAEGFHFLCKDCFKSMHLHTSRQKHEPAEMKIKNKQIVESKLHCQLELFAVVCINTSHYVAFVKCGDQWVFFDSMADREGNDEAGYNIPEITPLTELQDYLDGTFDFKKLKKKMHDGVNDKLLRFFDDPSLCLYRNRQFIGYQ